MADGPVYTGLAWATYTSLVRAYCGVDGSDHDDLLEVLFNASKRKADEYLNNPFTEIVPTVVFDGVVADDYIIVNGKTYTCKATADEDELEFALGATDSDTADNFAAYVNSTSLGGSYGATGAEGVTAANTSGSVTLTADYGNADGIVVTSSDDDTLLARDVLTSKTIPEDVNQWIYQRVRRHFRNRSALMSESQSGIGQNMYVSMKSEESGMADTFDTISHLRLTPGLG